MDIEIRPVEAIAEYHGCEELQRLAWAMPDSQLEVVPLHLLRAVHDNGGLVLGAFDGGEMVGFVFGFPGLHAAGRLKHCSHMMGVRPDYQGRGVGHQLKLAQRAAVLDQGLDLVTWTYDPLESRNAYLNLHKLGATCRTYIRDLYGPMRDGLNAGLPTDRFQLEWWIASEWVEGRLAGDPGLPRSESPQQVNITGQAPSGRVTPGEYSLDLEAPWLQVEIPADFQAVKAADPGLARAWRFATREIFESYFAAGYAAADYRTDTAGGQRRGFYVLAGPVNPLP